ncbi:MAG: imidazole glycerol phosphate synthase subunit HisF [Chitinophagales bacterium]|nr:imidazole glycerol phosphate synthase subunit HisF [Chitinophagales bacterium]
MLKKRIIPCLDIKDGVTVKGIHFDNIKEAGDPVVLAKKYVEEGADELVFLDITATVEQRKTMAALVEKIAYEINIPFTVGGGIHSYEDARVLIQSGADKVTINTAAIQNPQIISEIAAEYGSQCVVVAMDVGYVNNRWTVFSHAGKRITSLAAEEWALRVAELGAGEILLTSINNDGTQKGFALDITQKICGLVSIPVIASGGAGNEEHFKEVFQQTRASAALAASIFHFNQITIPKLKLYLKNHNIPVR